VHVPAVLHEPGFRLFWLGTVFSQIGTRGTVAANLANALGVPLALIAGATVTVLYAVWLAVAGHTVKDYRS